MTDLDFGIRKPVYVNFPTKKSEEKATKRELEWLASMNILSYQTIIDEDNKKRYKVYFHSRRTQYAFGRNILENDELWELS